jgi:hypothetical protein
MLKVETKKNANTDEMETEKEKIKTAEDNSICYK